MLKATSPLHLDITNKNCINNNFVLSDLFVDIDGNEAKIENMALTFVYDEIGAGRPQVCSTRKIMPIFART